MMFTRMHTVGAACVLAAGLAGWARAQCPPPAQWQVDETTTGGEVSWTSPTSVDPNAPRYEGSYTIITAEAGISWMGIPFPAIDVTSLLDPEDLSDIDITNGPAPVELSNRSVEYPEPDPENPQPVAVTADVLITLDENGYGQASITNVTLGTLEVNLGGIFGTQEVTVTSLRVVLDVTVQPLDIPADVDRDCEVGVNDFFALLQHWGACPVESPCPWDIAPVDAETGDYGDGVVNVDDFFSLLQNWG
jgi:hypothetical protein